MGECELMEIREQLESWGRKTQMLPPQEEIALLVERGRQGLLTTREFLRNYTHFTTSYFFRDEYVQQVSWAVFTVEYIGWLAEMCKGLRVLEVAAGRGVLANLMQRKGIDWIATDKHPSEETSTSVEKLTAIKAVNKYAQDVDMIFASWVHYTNSFDVLLAKNKPCVFIGESGGGCASSEKLWSGPAVGIIYEFVAPVDCTEIVDVPQWPGIHDFTFFTKLVGSAHPFPVRMEPVSKWEND